jgi:hypothetical protein
MAGEDRYIERERPAEHADPRAARGRRPLDWDLDQDES